MTVRETLRVRDLAKAALRQSVFRDSMANLVFAGTSTISVTPRFSQHVRQQAVDFPADTTQIDWPAMIDVNWPLELVTMPALFVWEEPIEMQFIIASDGSGRILDRPFVDHQTVLATFHMPPSMTPDPFVDTIILGKEPKLVDGVREHSPDQDAPAVWVPVKKHQNRLDVLQPLTREQVTKNPYRPSWHGHIHPDGSITSGYWSWGMSVFKNHAESQMSFCSRFDHSFAWTVGRGEFRDADNLTHAEVRAIYRSGSSYVVLDLPGGNQ